MSDLEIGRLGTAEDADTLTSGERAAHVPPMPLPVGLYIHVPFCLSKCAYCDFESAVSDSRWHTPYVDAVLFAAAHWASYELLDDVPTLYFGGGTPTILGNELVRLVEGLRDIATIRPGAEITVETNPDTTDAALVAALVAAGVNRFSLGVQSLDDVVLRALGRRHSAADALDAARVLAGSGQAYSVDLICGVPGQDRQSWRTTLVAALGAGAGHMSVYPLSIEDGTPLAERIAAGAMPQPDPDEAAAMMQTAARMLSEVGLDRYEVANYARLGEESRHNSSYWTGVAYLGIGPSAASMLPADAFAHVADAEGWSRDVRVEGAAIASQDAEAAFERAARIRFTATSDTTAFIRQPLAEPAEIERLTASEVAREDVMLGMRLTCGVSAEEIEAAGLSEVFAGLAADGLVEPTPDTRWRVTERGWLLGNEVFGRIWQGSE